MTDPQGFQIHGPLEHPRANTVLILGALGILCFGILSPVAWILGVRALDEIDASGGYYGGRQQARLGMFLGIIGTVMMIVLALLYLLDGCGS